MPARRQRGEGSIYKRPDGLWVGLLNLGRHNGVRKRKVVYGKTKKAAAEKLYAARIEWERTGTLTDAHATVGSWLTAWLERLEKDRAVTPSTHAGYVSKMQHVIDVAGKKRLDRLEVEHVREVYRHLAPDHAKSYIVQTHRILSKAMKDAYVEGATSRNVMERVTTPNLGKRAKVTRPLALPELLAIGQAAEGDRLQTRYAAQAVLGMRQGEISGLGWEDVDLEAGTFTIRRALQRQKTGLTFVEPKSEMSQRTLPLPPLLLEAMRSRYAAWLGEDHPDLSGFGDLAPHALVWGKSDGQPRDHNHDLRGWHALLERAGVERCGTHSMRHGLATLLSDLGEPVKAAQVILGHADPNLTSRVYTHADDAAKRKALTAAEAAMSHGEA